MGYFRKIATSPHNGYCNQDYDNVSYYEISHELTLLYSLSKVIDFPPSLLKTLMSGPHRTWDLRFRLLPCTYHLLSCQILDAQRMIMPWQSIRKNIPNKVQMQQIRWLVRRKQEMERLG